MQNALRTNRESNSTEAVSLLAICRASADSLRLDILRVLRRDSFGVQELAFIFAMPQPGMSHHLKILATAGLVETRRQGNSIFYRRPALSNVTPYCELLRSLFEAADKQSVDAKAKARVEKIYKDRARQSKSFFEKHAKEFIDRQRSLCELDQYLPNMRELLDLANLARQSRVLEVGPGQGLFLKELAKRFEKIVALDNSDEMLRLAQNEMSHSQHGANIEFVHSALETYEGGAFDAIILNMVLHHTPSPDVFFESLSQRLRPGGFLLVAELCAHAQTWTKDSCGDLWLGFEPEELNTWGSGAGLTEKQSLYLGLKNGFQIQLKLFQKQSSQFS